MSSGIPTHDIDHRHRACRALGHPGPGHQRPRGLRRGGNVDDHRARRTTGGQRDAGRCQHRLTLSATIIGPDGRAQTRASLGSRPGPYRITATCPSCTTGSPVVFTATAIGCEGLSIDLWPTEVSPAATGGISTSVVVARVAQPTAGCSVAFEVEPRSSEGHDHGIHPKAKGGIFLPMACTVNENSPICQVIYSAPEIAGEEQITVILKQGTTEVERQTASMRVRVPGLTALPAGGAVYELLRSDHHGTQTHYGVPGLVSKVVSLALVYNSELQRQDGLDHRLRIGNLSLPGGGLLDVFGDWKPPHQSHRRGVNVDISRHVVDQSLSLIRFGTMQDKLDDIAETLDLKRLIEDSRDECPDLKPGEPPCIHYNF